MIYRSKGWFTTNIALNKVTRYHTYFLTVRRTRNHTPWADVPRSISPQQVRWLYRKGQGCKNPVQSIPNTHISALATLSFVGEEPSFEFHIGYFAQFDTIGKYYTKK